ncbi:hypothetical protein ACOZ38_24965 [Sphaerisporangium viridialbum]|uniref:hypothetical protein n=1 Tax=Sphaerisporangium viridialbum TaxID=46189 RepID=UPI003C79655C
MNRAELAAAFDKQRAERAERRAEAQPTSKADPSAALAADLIALAKYSARVTKRFRGRVPLDMAQQADVAVALDDLDVFLKWARQVSAIPAVSVPAPRRAPRETVSA